MKKVKRMEDEKMLEYKDFICKGFHLTEESKRECKKILEHARKRKEW